MIRLEGEHGAAPTTMLGRVQAFREIVRPGFWFHDVEAEMVTYVDAKWYKPPRWGTPRMNAESGCPVLHTDAHPSLERGLWPAEQIVPVSIALPPYIKPGSSGRPDASHSQVLAADPDLLTRDYVPKAAEM